MTSEIIPQPVYQLPGPRDLARLLEAQLMRHVMAARAERGEVHIPEDVYALVRSLRGAHELLADYADAFAKAAKAAKAEAEEELMAAVGEQDGVPNGSLTVPDSDGDVTIAPVHDNEYSIDVESLTSAVCALVAERCAPPEGEVDAAEVADEAIRELLSCGRFVPQVRKVREFARTLARDGRDDLSGVVTTAVRRVRTFKRVRFERA